MSQWAEGLLEECLVREFPLGDCASRIIPFIALRTNFRSAIGRSSARSCVGILRGWNSSRPPWSCRVDCPACCGQFSAGSWGLHDCIDRDSAPLAILPGCRCRQVDFACTWSFIRAAHRDNRDLEARVLQQAHHHMLLLCSHGSIRGYGHAYASERFVVLCRSRGCS